MTRKILFALYPMLLLTLLLLPGCDSESDAVSAPIDESTVGAENESPDAPDVPEEPAVDTPPALTGDSSSDVATDPIPPEDPDAPSAYVVIQNAGPRDPKLLVYELQQVLRKTQVVKQVQSPVEREIKLEVTNIRDVRALANKIPFGSVEKIDQATRTITVEF